MKQHDSTAELIGFAFVIAWLAVLAFIVLALAS
jgi:hypothetical protein